MNRFALTLFAGFLSLFPLMAWAAPGGGGGNSEVVEIILNYAAGELTILGNGLSDGSATPQVELGGTTLNVSSFDENSIVADADLDSYPAGDYRLAIDPNFKQGKAVETLLTLGAVGPEGPQGLSGNLELANQACNAGQVLRGFDSAGDILCSGIRLPGEACPSDDYCEQGLQCADGNCCTTACDGTCSACNLASAAGTCSPIPQGDDPDDECGALYCGSFYWGWVGDICYARASLAAGSVGCDGNFQCESAADLCPNAPQGAAYIQCEATCQEPATGTCTGTTAGQCNNLDLGETSCGVGACRRTVSTCLDGTPQTCIPGLPSPEICNGLDDDCDGIVDEDC